MPLGKPDLILDPGVSSEPRDVAKRRWGMVTTLLASGFFLETVFAGAMLSGAGWARAAHAGTAALLIVSTATAGLVSLATQRGLPPASRPGFTLLALAIAAAVQAALGALAAKGVNLTWLHVPLGVALVGLALRAVAIVRSPGAD